MLFIFFLHNDVFPSSLFSFRRLSARQSAGSFACRDCGLPMCGERCADAAEIHKSAECGAFARLPESQRRRRIAVADCSGNDDQQADHPLYQCITPLRCLALKRSQPQHWRAMAVSKKIIALYMGHMASGAVRSETFC